MNPYIATFVPIIVAALTAIFAAFVFNYQKRREQLIKRGNDAQDRYEKYLSSMLAYAQDTDNSEKMTTFHQAQIGLRLYASKEVLENAKALEMHLTSEERAENPQEIAARTLLAMRMQVQGTKDLSVLEMIKLKPFKI